LRQSPCGHVESRPRVPGEAALVERDARDHGRAGFLTGGEERVLGVLVEDVVDDLDAVDEARIDRLQHVRRLPAIDADAEAEDEAAPLQVLGRAPPAVVLHPRVAPDVELLQVDALDAEVPGARFGHRDDVVVREDIAGRRRREARPVAVLRRHLGRDVEPLPRVSAQRLGEEFLAVPSP
jgi:hypothetical protein